MTAFFSNAKKPQETDSAPYRMAQEYKAHVDSSDTQAASFRLPQKHAAYCPPRVWRQYKCPSGTTHKNTLNCTV